MNKIRKHWINVLASFMLAGMFACSGNELGQLEKSQEVFESGRAVDLITQTIETDTVGGLETSLKAAMGEEVGTLQKLIIKGPISATDWTYVRSLSELVEIDMKETQIVGGESFNYGYWSEEFRNDTIANYMFYNYYSDSAFDKLEKVILPSNVKYIGENAFYDCKALQSVETPTTLEGIGYGAFRYCEALESINLNEGLTSIGQAAFYESDLKSVELPASLTSLAHEAFRECKSLASVSFLGDKVLSIDDFTFYNCSALSSVTLPNNLEVIGEYAFNGCSALASITLPESLKEIGGYAFEYCSALTEITIPKSVTTLTGNHIFHCCWALKSAKVLAEVEKLPYGFFRSCTALETVELSPTITELGDYACDDCNWTDDAPFANIKKLNYGSFGSCPFKTFDLSNITSLGEYTFSHCSQLESVTFPEGITTLPNGFFKMCTSLVSMTLPNTITSIGSHAFESSGLTTIEIPSSVTTIGYGAFSHSQIGELTIPETVISVENNFVDNCENLYAVYWNSPIEVPYNYGTKTCFLYLANGNIAYNRDSWKNVIMGDVAESIELNEDYVYNRRASKFTSMKKFLAKKITYTRRFDSSTEPGKSSGWETLTLPFTPTSITHDSKGVVAPFNSEVEGAKPFWLRELTAEGFVDVTKIEPNKPYIIAMPNHWEYLDEYCLNGDITFSADSIYIDVTPETLTPSIGPNFELHPCYAKVAKSATVYSLNSEEWVSGYDYGSVFVRSLDDVYTFEAYVTTLGGGRSARSLFDTRSQATRAAWQRNDTGIPQIGDM